MTSTTQLIPLRYNSPTVTLEVMVREAAVSQWSDKPVVEVLQYQLQIRSMSGEGNPVKIQGDRISFLSLTEAIQAYIQAQLMGLEVERGGAPSTPYLESLGFTQHTLHLDTLRTESGDTTIILGVVQLADLGDVLEQLNAHVRPLPVPLIASQPRRLWRRWPGRQWGAAAAGIVAAVGVTTVLWPEYQLRQNVGSLAPGAPVTEEIPAVSESTEEEVRSPLPETAEETTPETAAPEAVAPVAKIPEAEGSQSGGRRETAPKTIEEDGVSPASPQPPSPTASQSPTAPQSPMTTPQAEAVPSASPSPPAVVSVPSPDIAASSSPEVPEEAHEAPGEAQEAQRMEPFGVNESITAETAPIDTSDGLDDASMPQRAASSVDARSLAVLVESVRDRWTPPESLAQTLTYTLVFAADGTLTAVIPADDLSEQYREQTGIPDVGTEWLPSGNPQTLQLQLRPNGDVEFQEATPE